MPLSEHERTWLEQCPKHAFMRDLWIVLRSRDVWHARTLYFSRTSQRHEERVTRLLENIDETKQLALTRCIKEGWELPT